MAEHAEKEGVLLLVEPEPGLLIETAEQFLEFIGHVDSPAVGLNFDIGHAFCVGDDPAATIPRVRQYIRHFHLEDIAATRVHHHLVPGDGAIDFVPVLQVLADAGYEGWLVVEAEQDPAKAHPLTYATLGYRNLSALARQAGFTIIE